MEYFKKVGKPTTEEQAVIEQIERLLREKQIPYTELPMCNNLDDLLEVLGLLDAYVPDQEVQTLPATENTEEKVDDQEIDHADQNGLQPKNNEQEQQENDSSPVEVVAEGSTVSNENNVSATNGDSGPAQTTAPKFVAQDYDPFSDEIKMRSYNSNGANQKSTTEQGGSQSITEQSGSDNLEEAPIDNLNPKTKRRVAEQTADTILKGYSRLAPKPFKWLAKIDEEKIEKMHFEGEIDITLEVSSGTTFEDYVRQTNEKVDELLEVDEDTLEEIREPLIEVLMEQKLELTPQQRLGMAVVSHLVQMFSVAMSLRKQNNRILEYQKRMTILGAKAKAA